MRVAIYGLAALVALLPQQQPRTPYEEIVALQNRAAQGTNDAQQTVDLRRSVEIAQTLKRPRLLAVVWQRLGRYLERTNIQESVIAYEAGLRALADEPNLNVQNELDAIKSASKGFGGTRSLPADLYSRPLDLELSAAEADETLVAQLLLDIGNMYLAQSQLELATRRYEAVLARPEIVHAPKLRAYALANRGEILRRQGKLDDAERQLRDALDLLGKTSPSVDSRRALVMLASIDRDLDRDEAALTGYNRALSLYAQSRDARGEGRAYASLGVLHLKARRFKDAATAYERAIDRANEAKDELSLWYAYWGQGQVRRALGDLPGAVKSLEESVKRLSAGQQLLSTDEGKVTMLESAQDVFNELIVLYLETGSADAVGKALIAAERARAGALRELMGSSGRARLKCPAPATPKPAAAPASPMSQTAPSTASGKAVPDEYAAADPRCAPGRVAPGNVTPPVLARLVFHVLGDRTLVFAVDRTGKTQVHKSNLGRDALTRLIAEFRDALGVDSGRPGLDLSVTLKTQEPDAYRAASRRLYRELIGPLAGTLAEKEPVVIEPHGPLWLVPFAALEDDAGRPIVGRWTILYAPSNEVLQEIRRETAFELPRDLSALIVGNPTASVEVKLSRDPFRDASAAVRATFQPLPAAEKEAKSIAEMLPPSAPRTLLIGPDATLKTVKSEMPSSTLIHLASHAMAIPERPLESFVLMAGNPAEAQLQAREVLNVRVRADLVTLSACQTGMGHLSGDGVIGLSRAFLAQGARTVVVSQWNVDDSATFALMQSFYKRYLGGVDKARALQEAMNEVRATPNFSHPRFWAPFTLIGSER